MAAWFRGFFLLLLIPLALADTEPPCDGFEVLEGFGLAELKPPYQIGVKLLESLEDAEENCTSRCCDNDKCDLAVLSGGMCYLLRCGFKDFNMCELSKQEGARSFRRQGAGAPPKQEDFCLEEAKTGPCRASFRKWGYDAKSETCKIFTFGGCPVNLNNHAGEEECMNKCRGVKAVEPHEPEPPPKRLVAPGSLPEFCSAPAVTGNCRAAFTRWYFDAESMSCRRFIFGGCGGNNNNHMTENDCMDKCPGADNSADHSILHRPLAAIVLPALLAILAAALLGAMILFFLKVSKKNQQNSTFRAMWNPIDDKECLMNNAYTL